MSELEELPSWAGRSTGDQQPEGTAGQGRVLADGTPSATVTTQLDAHGQIPAAQQVVVQQPRKRRPWRVALLALLGLAALLGVGAAGYFLASSQDSSSTEAAGDVADAEQDTQLGSQEVTEDDTAADAEAVATDDTDTATDADDAATDTDEDAVTVDVEDDATTDGSEDGDAMADDEADEADDADAETDAGADDSALPGLDSGRQAIFRGGKVYLSGPIPSEEIGRVIEERAAAVVGPDNVVNEYTIDPEAIIEPGSSAPLYVEDVVLFEFNSVEVAQPFLPILDLGTLLLRQNPQASVTVVTRTDATGSEEVNLDVATKRAQAVINYWLGKGVNPDQINADPRGEEGASEDDDEQTAALNRRAEFIISGLLD